MRTLPRPKKTHAMIKRIFALCLSLLAAGVSAQECIPLDSRSGHIRWEVRPSEGDALPAVPAIVPGCVFASYVAAGVEADPNFGDNAYRTDKSRYDRNFRYTGLFPTPPVGEGRTLWLRFEGVNRKGTVRLNGHQLGHLDGFMQPGTTTSPGSWHPMGRTASKSRSNGWDTPCPISAARPISPAPGGTGCPMPRGC